MGGGRYDGLVEEMGGPPTPAVGWAAGIERLAMLLDDAAAGRRRRSPWCRSARRRKRRRSACCNRCARPASAPRWRIAAICAGGMERANRIGARAAVILGEDDLAQGVAQVKDLATGEQEAVALADVAATDMSMHAQGK